MKINGFERYIVTEYGDVININTNRLLKKEVTNAGYLRVTLSNSNNKKKVFIHRLVAEYYIENKDNKKFVNHKDGNKSNNNVSNLEWVTNKENMIHAIDVLGVKFDVSREPKKVLIEFKDSDLVCIVRSIKEASRLSNVTPKQIRYRIKKGTFINGVKMSLQ